MTNLVRINKIDRLYVIAAGDGYSCIGFDVAERRRKAYAEWLARVTRDRNWIVNATPPRPGTAAAYKAYRVACGAVIDYCNRHKVRCDVELTPALVGLEGKRVEVLAPGGSRTRFRVGKSTGVLPIHIALANSKSHGGPAVMWEDGSTVRVIDG